MWQPLPGCGELPVPLLQDLLLINTADRTNGELKFSIDFLIQEKRFMFIFSEISTF